MYLTFPQRMLKIANKTRWLIILLVLLLIKIFPREGINYSQIHILLILIGIYNILAGFILAKKWKQEKDHQICYAESTLDIVFITGIIYLTGGLQSNFFLLYLIVVMFAGIYYRTGGCFLVAAFISLLYILIGVINEPSLFPLLPVLLIRMPILFAIAGFSSYLSQEIRLQSEELEVERGRFRKSVKQLKTNLRNIEEKDKALDEFKFHDLSLRIGGSLSLEEQLDTIIDVASKFLKANLTAISLLDEKKKELRLKASKGDMLLGPPLKDRARMEKSLLGEMIRTGEPLVISNLSETELQKHLILPGQKVFSLLSAPLKLEDRAIGIFTCAYSKPMEFEEDQLKFLTLIGSRAALAINNAQLHEDIKKLAITDGLTGLYNYRYFKESLEREVERCRRLETALSLLMIDADYFKKFNDTYGHQEGDAFLQRLGMLLNFQVRQQADVAARYGGEEFVIVAPETSSEESFLLGERIRREVEERLFTRQDKIRLKISSPTTVSIGVACFPGDARNGEELIKCADKALYEAKETGRNKVVAYKKITKEGMVIK